MNAGEFGFPGGFGASSAKVSAIKGRNAIGAGTVGVTLTGVEVFTTAAAFVAGPVMQNIVNIQGTGVLQFAAASTTTGASYRMEVWIDGAMIYGYTTPGSGGNPDLLNPVGTYMRDGTAAIASGFDAIPFVSGFQLKLGVAAGGAANTLAIMAAWKLYQ